MVSSHHFEVALEACLDLARQGFDVKYRNLFLALPETEWTFGKDEQAFRSLLRLDSLVGSKFGPVARGFSQLERLSDAARVRVDAALVTAADLSPDDFMFPSFETLDELREVTFGPARLGLGVVSSLISFTKDSAVRPLDHVEKVDRLLRASAMAGIWLKGWLDENSDVNLVSVFNGRFAVARTLADFAEDAGRTVMYRERSPNLMNTTYFHEEFSPHDQELLGDSVNAEWNSRQFRSPAWSRLVGSYFFNWAASRTSAGADGFPVPGRIPVNNNLQIEADDRPVIAFFNSSDDEFAATTIGLESSFEDQVEAAHYLQKLAREMNFRLLVRIHPRIATLAQSERIKWDEEVFQEDENVHIVPSSSQQSSYQIIGQANLVIVWHSTIASEAVYLGKPAISLTRSTFVVAGVDIAFPNSKSELRKMLEAPYLPPLKESALIRGFAAVGMGIPLKHYIATSSWAGFFGGTDLFMWVKVLRRMKRFTYNLFERYRSALSVANVRLGDPTQSPATDPRQGQRNGRVRPLDSE